MRMHPSTLANLNKVQDYGNHIIPTEYGALASGLTGDGRMAEPENMLQLLSVFFEIKEHLSNEISNKLFLASSVRNLLKFASNVSYLFLKFFLKVILNFNAKKKNNTPFFF